MAEKEEQFKTTWKGGYDKDDVLQGFEDLRGDIYEEQHRLQGRIEELDRHIAGRRKELADLEERISRCDGELADLQNNVRENYQTYIDSYDAIGSQIFESRLYADQVQKAAQEEKAQLLAEALDEARQTRDDALAEASRIREEARAEAERQVGDARRASGRQADIGRCKYEAVQRELHAILGDFSQLQRKFMSAYKSINDVLNDESGDLARLRIEELDELGAGRPAKPGEETSAKQETDPEEEIAAAVAENTAPDEVPEDAPADAETDPAATIRIPEIPEEEKTAAALPADPEEAARFAEAVSAQPTQDLSRVRETLAGSGETQESAPEGDGE